MYLDHGSPSEGILSKKTIQNHTPKCNKVRTSLLKNSRISVQIVLGMDSKKVLWCILMVFESIPSSQPMILRFSNVHEPQIPWNDNLPAMNQNDCFKTGITVFRALVMVKTGLAALFGTVRSILVIFMKKDQNRLATRQFIRDFAPSAT